MTIHRSSRALFSALRIAAFTAIALAVPSLAGATVLSFTGTPTYVGLSSGASLVDQDSVLSGSISFSSDMLGGAFAAGDIDSLDLHIGGLDFGFASVPGNSVLTGSVSDDGASLNSFLYQITFPMGNASCAACSLNLGQSPGHFSANYNTLSNGSGILVGDFTASVQSGADGDTDIPEPSALLMFGFGLALSALGVRRRRAV